VCALGARSIGIAVSNWCSTRGGGTPKTYHVPQEQVPEVKARIALRKEFEEKVKGILRINLERWLSGKKKD